MLDGVGWVVLCGRWDTLKISALAGSGNGTRYVISLCYIGEDVVEGKFLVDG